jgi:RNA polymerase sigma-70 factor (ECF subfamily)
MEALCTGSIISSAGFARAVRSIMPSLRGYTRRLTHGDGEDLVQDTLMRAWGARARFEPGSNFKAWLFRIARNSFLSAIKRSGRAVQWDPDLHDRLLVSPPAQEEGLYLDDLGDALDSLPPAQREALFLVTREGLSYEDAARRTGEPLGTIKSRVTRARSALVEHFTDVVEPLAYDPSSPQPTAVANDDAAVASAYARWKASGSRTIG